MKYLYLAGACIWCLLGSTVGHAQPADAVALLQNDLEWVETAPGVAVADVYGDWKKEAHGMFFR